MLVLGTVKQHACEHFRELEALWGDNSEDDLFITKFCEKLKTALPAIFPSAIEVKRNWRFFH